MSALSSAALPFIPSRLPLMIGSHCVGSVRLADAQLCPAATGLNKVVSGYQLPENAAQCNAALALWANALRSAGRLKAWRNELLSVSALPAPDSVLTDLPIELAQLERGAARVLGILTHAVHLVGLAANGDVWLQHRALNKATDPGLWDTLAGGLLSAGDSLHSGMLRETHEEAGLLETDLINIQSHGMVQQRREVPDGLILEAVWTYSAVLVEGVKPKNLDGEVMDFDCVSRSQLAKLVSAGKVTREAVLALRMAGVV
jgi:8-oxo-dGTP pyrophosphatase MutT (NUDIX family)